MEFPQTGGPFLRHFEGSPNSPMHLYPSSIRQVLPQPSPGTVLPSSQDSPTSPMLFPQTGFDLKQTELVPRHWKPGLTLQFLEQPTPFLLSHSSVPSTIPLPHKEHRSSAHNCTAIGASLDQTTGTTTQSSSVVALFSWVDDAIGTNRLFGTKGGAANVSDAVVAWDD